MSEYEPKLTFEMNDAEYEVKRDNSQLWTFLGRSALDHIWLEHHTDEQGTPVGSRFWREVFEDDDMFNGIAQYMVVNDYESHINLKGVPESDIDSYVKFSTNNEESIPQDWL